MCESSRPISQYSTRMSCAPGDREPEQLFRRQAEGMLLVHRRDVVEPVEMDCLQMGLVLDQLFRAAMEQPDMRVDRSTICRQAPARDARRAPDAAAEVDGELRTLASAMGPLDRFLFGSLGLLRDPRLNLSQTTTTRSCRPSPIRSTPSCLDLERHRLPLTAVQSRPPSPSDRAGWPRRG